MRRADADASEVFDSGVLIQPVPFLDDRQIAIDLARPRLMQRNGDGGSSLPRV
jgi:hypothetical protein